SLKLGLKRRGRRTVASESFANTVTTVPSGRETPSRTPLPSTMELVATCMVLQRTVERKGSWRVIPKAASAGWEVLAWMRNCDVATPTSRESRGLLQMFPRLLQSFLQHPQIYTDFQGATPTSP